MDGSVSPSLTVCTPWPACARVVGLPGRFAPLVEAVVASAVCLSVILTSARIGSPLGRKSLYATVSWVQTDLNVVSLPHLKRTNGGAAPASPGLRPSLTSIILNSLSVMSRTWASLLTSDASSIRLSVSSRGLPPPNCAVGSELPCTSSYFQVLAFEIEYSVGLNSTGRGGWPSISSSA